MMLSKITVISRVSQFNNNLTCKNGDNTHVDGEKHDTLNVEKHVTITKIMASGPITSQEIDGETAETVSDFIFLDSKITADGDCSHEIKTLTPWKESYDQPRQHIKKQRHYFATKDLFGQGYGFSSGHVWM